MGRAASPPTWACYEQIPDGDEDSDSGSESSSEDEDEFPRTAAGQQPMSDSDEVDHAKGDNKVDDIHDIDMDMEEEGINAGADKKVDPQRDVKGKQRAIDPEPESKKHRRKKERPPVYTLRPILTIQKSQGFVWNQDLFVPPYIKDRYVASTSPPNSKGFISTPASSANPALPDYEVEVVEIRVNEGDLDYLRP